MSIKLSAFMTAYKFRKTQEEKEEMVKRYIKNEYVPYEKKANVAELIAQKCYWTFVKDSSGIQREVFHINSVLKYMCTCMSIFDLYTNIDRREGDEKMLDDFNTINEAGILKTVMDNIDPKELKEFNLIVNMTCDDVIANEYEGHAFINKQIDRIIDVIKTVIVPLAERLDLSELEDIINES